MTHDQYVEDSRRRARECALAIMAGHLDILDGSREIVSLLRAAEVPEADVDLQAMVLIESETDALPTPSRAGKWALEALAEQGPALDRARAWALEVGGDALRRIANLP